MQTYESVLARIEQGLAQGRWKMGDRLPSERAFSDEFEVSRASVREALRVLEAMGIVRRSTGSGPESGAILIDKPAAGLGSAMRLHIASGATSVRDVVEMRLLIEKWALPAVAMRCAAEQLHAESAATKTHSPNCLDRAKELLDLMANPVIDVEEFQQLDAAFHVELVSIAGNPLIEATMLGLRKSIEEYVRQGMGKLEDPRQLLMELHQQHTEIIETLALGNASLAQQLIHDHIEGFYRTALSN